MTARVAESLARAHGAGRFLVEGRPETGPWLSHPARVAALVERVQADLSPDGSVDEGLALAWTCDLLAETSIGVAALSAGLGRDRGALARMASRAVRGVDKTAKTPDVFWRVVARGPASVRMVAVCALVARLESAARWPAYLDGEALRAEARQIGPAVLDALPRTRALLVAAIG